VQLIIILIDFNCLPSWSGESFQNRLSEIGKSIVRFVNFFFQNLSELFAGKFSAVQWNVRNFAYLRVLSPFFLTSPPLFSENHSFGQAFSDLARAYQELNGLKDPVLLRKDLNRELKKGYCHALCLGLVELVLKNQSSLAEELPQLKSRGSRLTFFEILEIFRANFQKHKREDLLQKLEQFQFAGLSQEILYELETRDVATSLREDLTDKKSLVVIQLYNQVRSHTVILEVNSTENRYGFYNSASLGYYDYESLEELASAFLEHVGSHTPFLQKDPHTFWELSFY